MTLTRGLQIGQGKDAPHWDAIVVGAGLGGLSTAAFLATNGRRVLVLEQHEVVGGCAQVLRREGGHQLDVGLHQVGECEPGGRVRTLLAALGVDEQVEWLPLDADGFSTITLPDVQMRVPAGWEAYEQRLVETFPTEADGLHRCVEVLRAVADEVRAPRTRGALGAVRRLAGQRTLLRWGTRPLAALLDACNLGPSARAVVAAEWAGHVTPPSQVPVAVHARQLDHLLVSGAWYPRGGGQAVADELAQVVHRHGGEVHTRVHVDRVMMEGGRAVGVTLLDGTELRSEAVVSNSDPKRTYLGLVGREHLPDRLLRKAEAMEPALPLFTVHLVLDRDLRDSLPASTQWIHPRVDLEAHFAAVEAGRVEGPVPVMMTSATVKEPDSTRTAPAGHSTLELVTVAPARPATWGLRAGGPSAGERYSDEPAYLAAKERLLEAVLDTAETVLPGLRRHVVHQEASTPLTHERFTLSWAGTAHGLAMRRGQVGPFRPGVTTPIPGLFLAGAGTTYGPGAAAVLAGGAGTAGAVVGRNLEAEVAAGRTYGKRV